MPKKGDVTFKPVKEVFYLCNELLKYSRLKSVWVVCGRHALENLDFLRVAAGVAYFIVEQMFQCPCNDWSTVIGHHGKTSRVPCVMTRM